MRSPARYAAAAVARRPALRADGTDLHAERWPRVRRLARKLTRSHTSVTQRLQVAGEIGQLLELRRQHRGFRHVLLAHVGGAARAPRRRTQPRGRDRARSAGAGPRARRSGARRTARCRRARCPHSAVSACCRSSPRCVCAVPAAVGRGDLRDRLEAQHAPAAELAQPRECILESVDRPSASSSSTTNHSRWSASARFIASKIASRTQAAMIERSAAICAAL